MQLREKYTAINIILILATTILCVMLVRVWTTSVDRPVAVKVVKERVQVKRGKPKLPASYYNVIVAKDLFNPLRQGSAGQSALNSMALPVILPKEFTVVGTVLLADKKLAIINIKGSNEEPRFYSVGDTIGGGVIKDILEDKVILYGTTGRQAVPLRVEKISGAGAKTLKASGRIPPQRQRRISPKKFGSKPPQRQRQY